MSIKVLTADMIVIMSMIELESLFGPLFDEYFNGENQVVSKSSAVTTADVSDKRQQQSDSTSSTSTLATTITADGNFDIEESEKGIMPTKIELTLKQSQQGVSNDVLVQTSKLQPRSKSDSSPHAHTQALNINHSAYFPIIKDPQRAKDDQESQIKMIHVKKMMQDKDLKHSKSKDEGSRSSH
ncbi:hypothetical protein Tco_0824460 [Tanacetum coccineum]|uniref:Uncharacterized protein n=1 Tax=Tanacetum coccineum TaxID=301880 RepID=A0ABQ5AKU8_9ASTR